MTPKETLSAAFTTLNNELMAGTIDSAQYLDGFADAIDTDAQAEVVASGYGPRLNTAESNIASLQTSRTTDEANIEENTAAIPTKMPKPTTAGGMASPSTAALDAMAVGEFRSTNATLTVATPANNKKFLTFSVFSQGGNVSSGNTGIFTNGASFSVVPATFIWRIE